MIATKRICFCPVWLQAYLAATSADQRIAMYEWQGPLIHGRNDNLSASIGESVPFINHCANESIRELISRIVDRWDALYDNPASSIDVHPPVQGRIALTVYLRQAMRMKLEFLDIRLCDEESSLLTLLNTV